MRFSFFFTQKMSCGRSFHSISYRRCAFPPVTQPVVHHVKKNPIISLHLLVLLITSHFEFIFQRI